jgi:thiamine-phosphate diphosphorylase
VPPSGRHLPSSVLAIADWDTLGRETISRAEEAFRGGLRWVSLRAKGLSTAERLDAAKEILRRCPGVFLTVHDDSKAAEVLGTALHVPCRESFVEHARGRLPQTLLGGSCHDRTELERASNQGADYALLSPFFAPLSKVSERRELGIEGFHRLADGSRIPVLALGGVSAERIPAAYRAGARGVAVLGDLFLAPDVEARARELRRVALEAFGF